MRGNRKTGPRDLCQQVMQMRMQMQVFMPDLLAVMWPAAKSVQQTGRSPGPPEQSYQNRNITRT